MSVMLVNIGSQVATEKKYKNKPTANGRRKKGQKKKKKKGAKKIVLPCNTTKK